MKKSVHQIWREAKDKGLNKEQTKELYIKEGIIVKNNNWVSVQDSLPEDEINVLCFHSYS